MKIYIRAAFFNEEYSDDFIYGYKPEDIDQEDYPIEVLSDDPYEDSTGYSDFDEYDFYDYSEYEDFYKQIKKRKVYVPSHVASDIPDYNAYRKSLFGTLYLSMQSGEDIETIYNELCKDFPGIVKSDIWNVSDMLVEIVDATLYTQNLLNV